MLVALLSPLALALLLVPVLVPVVAQLARPVDRPSAGPSGACPADMRLVERDHAEWVEHLCARVRGTHCYAYVPDATLAEGPTEHLRFCMDQFEAPNVRGAKPLVMLSYVEAEAWCGARGKRMCREIEWESACEGDDDRPWVYGWSAEPRTCNSGKGWRKFDAFALVAGGARAKAEVERLWQGAPSGSFPECMSQDGIYDLVGNVEEWVASRPERRYRGALMGGFWAKPWTGCRGTNDAHEPEFKFYEVGFRCCADAK